MSLVMTGGKILYFIICGSDRLSLFSLIFMCQENPMVSLRVLHWVNIFCVPVKTKCPLIERVNYPWKSQALKDFVVFCLFCFVLHCPCCCLYGKISTMKEPMRTYFAIYCNKNWYFPLFWLVYVNYIQCLL